MMNFCILPRDCHWKVIYEANVARDLLVRDLAVAEGLDVSFREAGVGPQLDPGAQLLAIAGVGHAEHLHVLDAGVAVQELLDFARVHVLAATDHHVLDAADDVAEAFLVDGGEVARVHPAGGVDDGAGPLGVFP